MGSLGRLFVAVFLAAACGADLAAQGAEPTIVYVVRHAERVDDSSDSPISAAGEERARLLAEMLRDARITHIHTTDFRRTRATAAPVADRIGSSPAVYDVNDAVGLAVRIGSTPGRHLVVGHSNTMRETVSALGGEPGAEIAQLEYDRLYVLTLSGAGTATVLLRFGEMYRP